MEGMQCTLLLQRFCKSLYARRAGGGLHIRETEAIHVHVVVLTLKYYSPGTVYMYAVCTPPPTNTRQTYNVGTH